MAPKSGRTIPVSSSACLSVGVTAGCQWTFFTTTSLLFIFDNLYGIPFLRFLKVISFVAADANTDKPISYFLFYYHMV